MGYIYKIVNKVNNKCYIGQTIRHYGQRWRNHRSETFNVNSAKYDYPLYRAIRKYGLENFDFIIIEECNNKILTEREIYWTKYYNSVNNGYNQQYGTLFKDSIHTDINKELILSLFILKKSIADIKLETGYSKDIIRGVLYNAGYNSTETKNNGRKVQARKISKPVSQYDLKDNFIATFSSISEASKLTGVNGSHISAVCLGKRKTAGNYKWKRK